VVAATPEYATRWGCIHAADGNHRSVYSPVSSLAAAAFAWPLWKLGIVDILAPRASGLIGLSPQNVALVQRVAIQRIAEGRD